jgi:hypothetical protein
MGPSHVPAASAPVVFGPVEVSLERTNLPLQVHQLTLQRANVAVRRKRDAVQGPRRRSIGSSHHAAVEFPGDLDPPSELRRRQRLF